MEDLQVSVDILAGKLGFPAVKIPRINLSQRDEELVPETRRVFIARNRLELEIYRYAREHYRES